MNIRELSRLPQEQRDAFFKSLSTEEALALQYKWEFWAREGQLPPEGNWTYWLLNAGRGFGKTRVGAEFVRRLAESAYTPRIALVAPTNSDIRGVMLEGESGLLEISPNWFRPKFEPSKWRVVWPNGVIANLYSAEEPERLRGPQCGAFWADEVGAWKNQKMTWDMLQFGFRLGTHPLGCITTTPRPTPVIRKLIDMRKTGVCAVTAGSTYENRANLAPSFFREVITSYEGTRLGQQELDGIMLEDNPDALFSTALFDKNRVQDVPDDIDYVAVGVDPAVSANPDSDLTGIVAGGRKLIDGVMHYYVWKDASMIGTPAEWASAVASVYHRERANTVVAEVNNGGDLVISNITNIDASIKCKKVHATRGKTKRAEPVAALAEQGRLHIVGVLTELEDQCCDWNPTLTADQQKSPDRMDAMVWLVTFLMDAKKRGMSQGSSQG